jgi:hypothetical protein
MTAGTVGQNRRIYNLTTGATLPCIESTNKIKLLLIAYVFKNITKVSECTQEYYTRHANLSN